MDRSVSWTDANRVALLLIRASGGNRSPRPGIRPVPVLPARPPVLVQPKPQENVIAPLEQTADNPSDRLDVLIAWTLDNFKCSGAFVADDNGLTLAAHGISEAHVSLVGPLFSALAGIRTIPGIDATAGALLLSPNMMSWVEARAERGAFCLGVLGEQALSTRALEQLKDALQTTVRGL